MLRCGTAGGLCGALLEYGLPCPARKPTSDPAAGASHGTVLPDQRGRRTTPEH